MSRSSRSPQAVTFDCWNTLLCEEDWHDAHLLRVAALREAAAEAGVHATDAAVAAAFDRAWQRHMDLWVEEVVTGAADVARWALDELGATPAGPALAHLVTRFEEASHTSRVVALEGARETLEVLSAAGVRMALICDTGLTPGRVVRRHLEHQGLLGALPVQVFSDEIGVPKPSPRAFHTALDALGVAAERAVHVGDLRRTDVAGARGVGMGSVRLRARHDDETPLPEADRVADSHAALLAMLLP